MEYVRAGEVHLGSVAKLASLLWHDDDFTDLEHLRSQFGPVIQNENNAIFLCLDGDIDVGFAQFALRYDYVEGTSRRPVGYLEGIYVLDEYRRKGIARALVHLGELWAREKGCSQMASDCELTNVNSLRFHLRSGFAEANRIICFVKDIDTQEPGTGNN